MGEKISLREGEIRLSNNNHLCSYAATEFPTQFYVNRHYEVDREIYVYVKNGVCRIQLLQRKMAVFHKGRDLDAVWDKQNPKYFSQWLEHHLCTADIW